MTNPMHTPRAPRIPTLREEAIATAAAQWLADDLPATAGRTSITFEVGRTRVGVEWSPEYTSPGHHSTPGFAFIRPNSVWTA